MGGGMLGADPSQLGGASFDGTVVRRVLRFARPYRGMLLAYLGVQGSARAAMLLLNRFPIIVIAGGGLLGYIAGEVLATDPAYVEWLAARIPNHKMWFEIGCAVLTVALGYWLQRRARSKKHEEPVEAESHGA